MALRIACDLDGTLADMDAGLQREAKRLFGPDVDLHARGRGLESAEDVERGIATEQDAGPLDVPPVQRPRPLTGPELRQLWAHIGVVENFWMSLGEIEPGVLARFYALATARRWEVLFLTQRPPSGGETAQAQSHRWLSQHGFELPSIFVMNGSRGKVADALSIDVLIDDRPENCLDILTDSGAAALLIWRGRPESVPPGIRGSGIQVVFSMAEALERVQQMDDEKRKPRSLVGRVMSAIGLQRS